MKVPPYLKGDADYGRLFFQVLFTLLLAGASMWLIPRFKDDFRDLEAGRIRKVKVDIFSAWAYRKFGATGGIVGVHIVCIGGTLLSLIGIKEALEEMKADYRRKQNKRMETELRRLIWEASKPPRKLDK